MGGSQGHVLWLCLQFKHLQTSLISQCGECGAGARSADITGVFWVYRSSAKGSLPSWSLVDQEGPVNILIPSPPTPAPCPSRWS